MEREVVEAARAHSPEAIETLVAMMRNEKAKPAERITAANAILDRAYGKPAVIASLDHSGSVTINRTVYDDGMAIIVGGENAEQLH